MTSAKLDSNVMRRPFKCVRVPSHQLNLSALNRVWLHPITCRIWWSTSIDSWGNNNCSYNLILLDNFISRSIYCWVSNCVGVNYICVYTWNNFIITISNCLDNCYLSRIIIVVETITPASLRSPRIIVSVLDPDNVIAWVEWYQQCQQLWSTYQHYFLMNLLNQNKQFLRLINLCLQIQIW